MKIYKMDQQMNQYLNKKLIVKKHIKRNMKEVEKIQFYLVYLMIVKMSPKNKIKISLLV